MTFNKKEYIKKWRKDNKEHIKEYGKTWRENNREYIKKYNKKRRKENPELWKKSRIKHRKEINVRQLTKRHIPIPKGQICQKCNKALVTERHHEDYDKPLVVDLVCKKCHTKLDKLKQERDNEEINARENGERGNN